MLNLAAPGRLEWQEAPDPVPGPGEELVRVRYAGICGTDLHAYHGRQPFFEYPRRLGHELCVELIDDSPSQAFAVNPYMHCGSCQPCCAGTTNCCEQLEVLGVHRDGGFAPLLIVPVSHLYAAQGLAAEALAVVEPLVVGHHAVARAGIAAGEAVLVAGLGPIGLGVALMAKCRGADLVACEARADRRQAGRSILDTDAVLESVQAWSHSFVKGLEVVCRA